MHNPDRIDDFCKADDDFHELLMSTLPNKYLRSAYDRITCLLYTSLGKARNEAAPQAGVGFFHGHAGAPAIKATADLHGGGTGGPDGE